ncbi:MAG: transposase [Armatimonadetes bacterium]|nr:transposase [Armatimonadota bacterium]
MLQLIPPQELCSLFSWFAPCFTAPSLVYFVNFVVCLMVNLGRGTTTTVCRTSPGDRHWTNYCRFLSRYHWSVRKLAQHLLALLLTHGALWRDDQGRRRLCIVLDETIVEKSSKRMFGVAWQRNTHGGLCRGTHILGHYWLVLAVQVRVATRRFCCPIALRLYRQKKRCPADEYRTPCQLARHLLRSLSWPQADDLVPTVVADAGFADSQLIRWCQRRGLAMIVRGRIDARVHELYVEPPQTPRGRPRKWGRMISLREFASEDRHFTQTLRLYQNQVEVQVASLVGRHHKSDLPMRFVLLRMAGKPDVVVMSTDLSLTPREVAQLYADRFAIELTFRELKQHFGLGHYQVRSPKGMLRHVHLSALACSLTQLLTLDPPRALHEALLPMMKHTPWRRYDTRSVGETQLLLRLACLLEPTFRHVAPERPHAQNSGHPPASALTVPTTALPTRRKC